MSDEQLLDILLRFSDYLILNEPLRSSGRSFLNWFAGILIWVVDNISGLLYETTQFFGFYDSDSIGDQGMFGILGYFRNFGLGISILLVGGILFFGKTAETREIPMNFLFMVLITLMLPGMMQQGIKIINSTVTEWQTEKGELGFQTFKAHVTDIYILAEHGWTTTTPTPSNYLKDRDNFDINEKVIEVPEGEGGEPLKYRLIDKKAGEGKEVVELIGEGRELSSQAAKSIFAESYYRWQVNWFFVIGTLVALAISLVISVIRSCRIAIGLGFDYVWVNLAAYFSLRDTKKLKAALTSILGSYILLFSIFCMYYIFLNWNSYIFSQTNVSNLTKIFGLLAGAWFIYDGPVIIQKTLGIDARLSAANTFLMSSGEEMQRSSDLTENVGETIVNHIMKSPDSHLNLFSNNDKNTEEQSVKFEIGKEKNQAEGSSIINYSEGDETSSILDSKLTKENEQHEINHFGSESEIEKNNEITQSNIKSIYMDYEWKAERSSEKTNINFQEETVSDKNHPHYSKNEQESIIVGNQHSRSTLEENRNQANEEFQLKNKSNEIKTSEYKDSSVFDNSKNEASLLSELYDSKGSIVSEKHNKKL